MPVTLKKKPKKCKSYTPIVIAVPKEQKEKIQKLFECSIKKIEDKQSTPTDWYNAAFRTKHALEIAKAVYTQEAVDDLTLILDTITKKSHRYGIDQFWYTFDDHELEQIKIMHEAMCTMEDEVTRRIQLDAILIAQKFMKQFIKKE